MALTPGRRTLTSSDGKSRLIYVTPSAEHYIWTYFRLRNALTATKGWMLRHRAAWPRSDAE